MYWILMVVSCILSRWFILYQIETLFSAGIDDNINSINQVMKVTQGLIDAWKEETGL